MAVAIMSANIFKMFSFPVKPVIGKNVICASNLKSIFPILSANICGKSSRDPDYKRPPPYPYLEKKYGLIRSWFDRSSHRFDENTKLLVVDGPISAGKAELAKELAEDFDMLYVPQTTMDDLYINPYGFDMRKLDDQLPKSIQSYDEKNFCMDPKGKNSAFYQVMLYRLRFSKYIDVLAHILSTGQGVVMVRSCFSDFVFLEASVREGYISKLAKSVYYDIKRHTIMNLLRPHLCIYLDVPVSKVQENIKKRNRPHEVNGKALTDSFLTNVEDVYKRQYLKEISNHAEILIYDWSDGGDVEVVIEDIERIDFNKYTKHDSKLADWFIEREQNWSDLRMEYADDKHSLLADFNVARFDCPELTMDGAEDKIYSEVWYSAPGMKYEVGYNADLGDTGIWLKNTTPRPI